MLLLIFLYWCILLAVHSLHLHEPTGITLHPTLCYKVQDSLTLKPAGYYATLHLHWILQDKLNPTGWNATVTGLYVELHTLLQAYRCINIGIPFLRICFSSITNRIYDRGSDIIMCLNPNTDWGGVLRYDNLSLELSTLRKGEDNYVYILYNLELIYSFSLHST